MGEEGSAARDPNRSSLRHLEENKNSPKQIEEDNRPPPPPASGGGVCGVCEGGCCITRVLLVLIPEDHTPLAVVEVARYGRVHSG
jgi:hypothetical protein